MQQQIDSARVFTMKEVDLNVISEELKNGHRSDRQLAKALNVSQPTVTRTRVKLEKDGLVKEYTVLPDFEKLGIKLAAFIFGIWSPDKMANHLPSERIEKAKNFLAKHPNAIFASAGLGLGMERIMISLHKNYSEYIEFMKQVREEWAGMVNFESFLISIEADLSPLPFARARYS